MVCIYALRYTSRQPEIASNLVFCYEWSSILIEYHIDLVLYSEVAKDATSRGVATLAIHTLTPEERQVLANSVKQERKLASEREAKLKEHTSGIVKSAQKAVLVEDTRHKKVKFATNGDVNVIENIILIYLRQIQLKCQCHMWISHYSLHYASLTIHNCES